MSIQSLHLVADINGDGSYSLWEIWEVVKFVYRLPGNLLVEGLGHIPYVSSILGIHASQTAGYGSLDGLLAVTLSLLFWVGILFALLTLSSPTVDEVDEFDPQTRRTPEAGPRAFRHTESEVAVRRTHHRASRVTGRALAGTMTRRHHRLAGMLTRHAR